MQLYKQGYKQSIPTQGEVNPNCPLQSDGHQRVSPFRGSEFSQVELWTRQDQFATRGKWISCVSKIRGGVIYGCGRGREDLEIHIDAFNWSYPVGQNGASVPSLSARTDAGIVCVKETVNCFQSKNADLQRQTLNNPAEKHWLWAWFFKMFILLVFSAEAVFWSELIFSGAGIPTHFSVGN